MHAHMHATSFQQSCASRPKRDKKGARLHTQLSSYFRILSADDRDCLPPSNNTLSAISPTLPQHPHTHRCGFLWMPGGPRVLDETLRSISVPTPPPQPPARSGAKYGHFPGNLVRCKRRTGRRRVCTSLPVTRGKGGMAAFTGRAEACEPEHWESKFKLQQLEFLSLKIYINHLTRGRFLEMSFTLILTY